MGRAWALLQGMDGEGMEEPPRWHQWNPLGKVTIVVRGVEIEERPEFAELYGKDLGTYERIGQAAQIQQREQDRLEYLKESAW